MNTPDPLPASHPHWQMPTDSDNYQPEPDQLPPMQERPADQAAKCSACQLPMATIEKARLYDLAKSLADQGKEGAAVALLKSGS